jgi:ATP-dependent exoDNAse (exonuclease V) beta subunit
VHRTFERFGLALAGQGRSAITDELAHLLNEEESAEERDLEELLGRASDAYLALCSQPALSVALNSGEALFEVPFSVRPASSQLILRGTFDCLVMRRDSGVTVLELKTGKPAPEHRQQLEIYLMAARALFPGRAVDGPYANIETRTGLPGPRTRASASTASADQQHRALWFHRSSVSHATQWGP